MRGHIVKRYENSWTIVGDLGRDPVSGKRKQQWISVKGTKKDAERRLTELLHSLETGQWVKPEHLTVGDFLERWLKDYAFTHVRPRTFTRYKTIIERHIIPALGRILLTQLTAAHVQECYAKWLQEGRMDGKGSGLSAKTVLQHHRVLSQALSHAVKWNLLARNVAQAVEPPRPVVKALRVLDGRAVQAFLEACKGTVYFPLFHLDIYTGLRRSELLGLRWRDVNLDMACLSVVQSMHRLAGGKVVFLEPKTARGRRQVALSPNPVLALRSYRETQEAMCADLGRTFSDNDLVFCNPDGAPFHPDTVSRAFQRIARNAGFDGVRLHDLRHTHATLMLQQGVHPKIVQERLGHATIAVTLDIYSHVLPGLQEAAALQFEEGLTGVKKSANHATATEDAR